MEAVPRGPPPATPHPSSKSTMTLHLTVRSGLRWRNLRTAKQGEPRACVPSMLKRGFGRRGGGGPCCPAGAGGLDPREHPLPTTLEHCNTDIKGPGGLPWDRATQAHLEGAQMDHGSSARQDRAARLPPWLLRKPQDEDHGHRSQVGATSLLSNVRLYNLKCRVLHLAGGP